MSEFTAGPAGRIERVRTLMVERGYDAIVVRDEANLRWLTGVKGVFDYTFEFPHAAFYYGRSVPVPHRLALPQQL